MRAGLRKALWVVGLVLGAALLVWALLPTPVEVDAAEVARGPIEVSVNEEGRTRVRDRYVIAAPLAGHLMRVDLRAGDAVTAVDSVLAVIRPDRPALLDARQQAEAEARVNMAQANLQRAEMMRQRSEAELAWAANERQRLQQLADTAAGRRELDDARFLERVRQHDLDAAQWGVQVAGHELELAQAALQHLQAQPTASADAGAELVLRAPVDGQVLRVVQESEGPVQPGSAILEIGQVEDLEVVMDVLSREAVRIRPGDPVRLIRWGGETDLHAVVRRVEPSGFTKISALGVEEQRVNVIADFTNPPAARGLGDGFRLDAQIIVDQRQDALKVPLGALLRHDEGWAVFAIVDETATLTPIQLGLRGSLEAEVLDGLHGGEMVIVYPGDQIRDGVRVAPR
jgi:HlyD family secretion protein